jgi:Ca-activated chloride channel family protein
MNTKYSRDLCRLARFPRLAPFIIVAFVLLGTGAVQGQDNQPAEVIKVYSNLVSVPVIVSDRDGRYIPGLKQEDFKLYDNNTQQTLTFFDAAAEPINVAVLLDTSRSTEGVLDDIKKAAKNFLKELRPQDRAMIVCFDYGVHKLSALTSDRTVLEDAIKRAEVGEYFGTVLNDAVLESVERDLKPINGRKAIILLTDGADAGSRIGQSELLAYASESDAMIYSIYYAPSMQGRRPGPFGRNRPFPGRGGIFGGRRPMRDRFPRQGGPRQEQRRERQDRRQQRQAERQESAEDFLAKLSEVSAGRFYQSEKADLKKTFVLVAEELRHQYRLGFVPDNLARDGSLHSLRVKVDKPDIAVRARPQYRAQQSQ